MAALSVADEPELIQLISIAKKNGVKHTVFREPDIQNQITAITLEATEKAAKLCAGLPLALKEFSSTGINKNNYKPKPQLT